MSLKDTTFRLSLALALFELVIWLALGVFASSSSETFSVSLLTYCAERFGEITVAIATTFYVIFTYRLLENSEAQRKHSLEPYLSIRWYQSPKRTNDQLKEMGQFSEKARSWLIEAVPLKPNAVDEAGMATGDRYLILELSNVRETPVGWINFAVKGRLEISGSQPVRFWDQLHLEDLKIGIGESIKVTMLDLFPIPRTADVTLDIEVMTYGAIAGGEVLDESAGASQKSVSGEFMPTDLKGPQPNDDAC